MSVHLYLRFIIDCFFCALDVFFRRSTLSTNPQHAGSPLVWVLSAPRQLFSVRFEPALTSWGPTKENAFVFFHEGLLSASIVARDTLPPLPGGLGTKPWESNFKSILQLLKLRCHQAESLAERSRWNLTIFVLHVSR